MLTASALLPAVPARASTTAWKHGKSVKVSVKQFQGNCSAENATCPQGGNGRQTTYSVVGEGSQIQGSFR